MFIEIGNDVDAVVIKYALLDGIRAIDDSYRFWSSPERRMEKEKIGHVLDQLQHDKGRIQRVVDAIDKQVDSRAVRMESDRDQLRTGRAK